MMMTLVLGVVGVALGGATIWAEHQRRKKEKQQPIVIRMQPIDYVSPELVAQIAARREMMRQAAHNALQSHPILEIEADLSDFSDAEDQENAPVFHDIVKPTSDAQTQTAAPAQPARPQVEPLKSHRSENGAEQTATPRQQQLSPATFDSLYESVWCGAKTHRARR